MTATTAALFAVHLIAYSDKINGGTCALLKTASAQGWTPVIVTDKFHGKRAKLEFWTSLAHTFVPNDDIVWIVDAWDTLVQVGPAHVKKRFERFEAYHGISDLIVVGAETNCWPFMYEKYAERCKWGVTNCSQMTPRNVSFLTSPTRYLYLNSGSIIMRARSLHVLNSLLQKTVLQDCSHDDQANLAAAYRFINDTAIRLDHDGLFSASAWDSIPDFVHSDHWIHHDIVPAAIHFNGAKENIARFLRVMQRHNGSFLHDWVPFSIGEACGNRPIDNNK